MEDYDPDIATEMVADNSIKQTVHLLSAELLFWIRCLVPGL